MADQGQADALYVDLKGRIDGFESKLAEIEKLSEQTGTRAGSKLGAALSAGLTVAATGAAVVAGALGAAAAGAVNLASEQSKAVGALEARLGSTTAEAERLGEVATRVFGNNFGGSLTEAADAVGVVRQQLGDLSDDELQRVAEGALAIKDSFGTEVPASVDAAKTLMEQFGLSSQEAFDFIAAGYQKGLDRSGDFLDTIGEYSTQFANGGASASEFFSLMESGMQGGMLGTDRAADAFKEFRVRIQDGSKTTSTALKEIGIDANQLAADMASGQTTAAEAFTLVQGKLAAVTDENVRMQAGVALLGTQYEDLGQKGAAALSLTGRSAEDLAGSTAKLNARYNTFGDFMAGLGRKVQVALLPAGQEVMKLANEAMPYLQKAASWLGDRLPGWIKTGVEMVKSFGSTSVNVYNAVRPGIDAVSTGVQKLSTFLERNKEIVIPLAAGITAAATAYGLYRVGVLAATVATTAWATAQTVATAASVALKAAITFLTGPVGIAITVIGALVAAGVYLYRNWDEVKAKALAIWSQIREAISGAMNGAVNFLRNINLRDIAVQMVLGLVNGIKGAAGLVLDAVRGLGGTVINGIKAILRIQSPSRVMEELGAFTGQGFVQGINSQRPSVKAAAEGTAKAFLGALSDLKLEQSTGRLDLSSYTKTLTDAAAQLRAKLATVKEGTPAYSAWLEALAKVQKELDGLKGKSQQTQTAARDLANQLAQNRKALEDNLKYESWKSGLDSLDDAQLAAAASAARARGDSQRYADILAVQTRRATEAAQAVSDLADAQIAAAGAAYQRDPQGATDSAYRQTYGAGDDGLIKALAATTGLSIQAIRDDVEGALADARRWNAGAAAIIERTWADALAHRREVAAEQTRLAEDTAKAERDAYASTRKFMVDSLGERTEDGLLRVSSYAYATRDQELIGLVYAEWERRAKATTLSVTEFQAAANERAADEAIKVADEMAKAGDLSGAIKHLQDVLSGLFERAQEGGEDAADGINKVTDAINRLSATLPDFSPTPAANGEVAALPSRTALPAPVAPAPARPEPVQQAPVTASPARSDLSADAAAWKAATEQAEYTRQAVEDYKASLASLTVEQLRTAQATALANGQQARYEVLAAVIKERVEAAAAATKKAAEESQKAQADAITSAVEYTDAQQSVADATMELAVLNGEIVPGDYDKQIAALEKLKAKFPGLTGEIDKLIAGYDRLNTKVANQKALEDKINTWGNYARQLIPVVQGAMEALGGTTSEVASQWASDLGSMVDDLVSFGTAIAKGDWFGAAVQALTTIFGWWNRNKRAAEEAARATREYNQQFRFSQDGYGTREVSSYTTGILFWQTTRYTESVDAAGKQLALGLESGVLNGISDGFTAALESGSFASFGKALETSIGKAVLAGLQAEYIANYVNEALGPLIGGVLSARKTADTADDVASAAALRQAAAGIAADAKVFYDQVLTPVAKEFGLFGSKSQEPSSGSAPTPVVLDAASISKAGELSLQPLIPAIEKLNVSVPIFDAAVLRFSGSAELIDRAAQLLMQYAGRQAVGSGPAPFTPTPR